MIDLVLEWNAEEPEEQEVWWGAHEEEEGSEPVVSKMLECQNGVGYEDADTICQHTTYPETNVFSVGLMGASLSANPEAAEENEGSVDQGIQ